MSLFRDLLVTTIASAALFGCGGSDSSANKLTQADVDQMSQTMSEAVASSNTTPSIRPRPDRGGNLTTTVPVSKVTPCPGGGHVTASGNIVVTCPTPPATGDCTIYGAVTFQYGDRTNNLNDCAYANGLVVDGTLNLTMTGGGSGAALKLTETINGLLSLNRKGPTGGLVPIEVSGLSSCFISLKAAVPAHTITGTVCGQAVNRTF